MHAVAPAPMRTRPATPPRCRRAVAEAAAASSKRRLACARRSRPAAVAKARLPMRSTKRTPSRASSCFTCRLIAGWVRLSRWAAAEKLPSATTSRSASSWSRLRFRISKFCFSFVSIQLISLIVKITASSPYVPVRYARAPFGLVGADLLRPFRYDADQHDLCREHPGADGALGDDGDRRRDGADRLQCR